MRDYDYNDFPLAYLITFRCYGTWFHGDQRGAYRRSYNVRSRVSWVEPKPELERAEVDQLKHEPVTLNARQRSIVDKAVREVCLQRKYAMRAINVRTNHVHTVVSAQGEPEPILNAFKSYATRALRLSKSLPGSTTPWARPGSTIYLWKARRDVEQGRRVRIAGSRSRLRNSMEPSLTVGLVLPIKD